MTQATTTRMDLPELLDRKAEEIITQAIEAMRRAHLVHYEKMGVAGSRQLVARLFDLTADAVRTRQLRAMNEFVERIAGERFAAGFDLFEVQTAFNVLEEAIWRTVLTDLAPEDAPRALGLVSTVLGMGKETLASRYLALAGRRETTPSLDLRALFEETG